MVQGNPTSRQGQITTRGRVMGDPEAVVAILEPASDSAIETPGPAPHERAPGRTSAVASLYHNWRSPKVFTSAVSASLLLLGWLIRSAGGSPHLVEACAIAAILSGAFYFGRRALMDLIVHRSIGFYFLMSAAAVVSALIGHAQEGAILVFLTSISEAAQDFTEWKTRSAIHALMNLAPKTALVQRGERTEEIPVEELVVGDLFIVKPGTAIATDGLVVEGTTDVNQASITGESQPVMKEPGDSVFAASINGPAALKVRATKTFADNTVARIIQMVEEAQEKKGTSQRFIERFGSRYSPIVVLAAILVAVLPPALAHAEWQTWITRATVLMVAASPCAVMISIPVTLVAALGTGARKGVLIKGGVFLEQMAGIKVGASGQFSRDRRGADRHRRRDRAAQRAPAGPGDHPPRPDPGLAAPRDRRVSRPGGIGRLGPNERDRRVCGSTGLLLDAVRSQSGQPRRRPRGLLAPGQDRGDGRRRGRRLGPDRAARSHPAWPQAHRLRTSRARHRAGRDVDRRQRPDRPEHRRPGRR